MYQRHTYPAADANAQGGAILGATLGHGVAAMSQQEVNRAPQVGESLKRMDACLGDLSSAMSALAARIDPVLRPQTAAGMGKTGDMPAPVRCPVSGQIDGQCERLCELTAELRDMLDRLEV